MNQPLLSVQTQVRVCLAGIILLSTAEMFVVRAQPILHQPQIGTGLTSSLYGTDGVQVPAGGENQVWDYSKNSGSFYWNTTMEPASNSSFSVDFPDADWLLTQPNNMSFNSIQDSVVEYGSVLGTPLASIVADDPNVMWKWPVHYGDVYADDFSLSGVLEGDSYVNFGSFEGVVDGWGSLYHPADTTYQDVLRMSWSIDQTEIYAGDTLYITYGRVDYFVDGTFFPVLIHEELTYQDVDSLVTFNGSALAWFGGQTLGLETNDEAPLELTVGPNPAVNMFTVSWNENRAPKSVSVLDVKGRVVARFDAESFAGSSVTVSDLPSGLYLVKGTWNEGEQTSRVIVQ